ncbi:MAG: HAMP domain-containing sensor histidine kinase [Bacillota bacterium]|nr:HAMP domain-containing sensor histidine kinase [Bacillota bacterium]
MSFKIYLKENYRLLIFYSVLMLFISMVIYFDRSNRLLSSNIFYILFVSLFIFIVYLIWDYSIKNNHIKKLRLSQASEDKTPVFPSPLEYKDEVYSVILQDLYSSYCTSLKNIEINSKENSEFMTTWVHEIKTPITTSKLLLNSMEDELQESSIIKSMKEEIDKIDEYVEKVLYYSRSDDFSKDYIISEVRLNSIIKESVKKHSIIFIRKQISFVNNIDDNLLIDTDRKWLVFIIDQLISNALKYTEPKGSIKFSSLENDAEKILAIQDTGIGIKEEDMHLLFNKSFTGNNGRNENSKSTGLGLYLSKKLAKKLGYGLTIESEYGKGTSVNIHFPKWNDYYITKM